MLEPISVKMSRRLTKKPIDALLRPSPSSALRRSATDELEMEESPGPGEPVSNLDPSTLNMTEDLEYHSIWTATSKLDVGTLLRADMSGRKIYLRKGSARGRYVEVQGVRVFAGVAVYLELGVATLDTSLNLSLPWLAAQAQIGNATVNYRLKIDGYRGDTRSYLSRGLFNVENYVSVIQQLAEATGNVLQDTANIDPVVVAVAVEATNTQEVDLIQAVAVRFALAQLAAGRTVTEAFHEARDRMLDQPELEAVQFAYQAIGVMGAEERPSREQRDRVKELLANR